MVHRFVHSWSGCGPPPRSSDATHAEGAEKYDCESQSPLNSASSHCLSSVFLMDSRFCSLSNPSKGYTWWKVWLAHQMLNQLEFWYKYLWTQIKSPDRKFFVVDQSITAARMLTVSLKSIQVFSYYWELSVLIHSGYVKILDGNV
jgi:hypothetical protein